MKTMSYTESRARYAEVLDSVINDREEVVITRAGHDPVVIVSLADFESLRETAYLMRSPGLGGLPVVANPGPHDVQAHQPAHPRHCAQTAIRGSASLNLSSTTSPATGPGASPTSTVWSARRPATRCESPPAATTTGGDPVGSGRRARSTWLAACSQVQSTATARAAQTSRMRASASRPSRSTSIAVDTLSTESRFTAERSGTGSSPGSRQTSLGIPLMVAVQGAINARRRRGIAASRERTTTGRRPI